MGEGAKGWQTMERWRSIFAADVCVQIREYNIMYYVYYNIR